MIFHTNAETTQASKWKLWKHSDSASVSYQKDEATLLYRIKATAKIQSTLSGFMLFLQDYQHIPNWLENANKSELIQQLSPYENVFITTFEGVWPVKERHLILHSKFKQKPDLSIDINIQNGEKKFTPQSLKSIGMELISGHWKISPIDEKFIQIQYTILVDPKGKIPRWLINKLALKSMWQTIKNMQHQVPKSVFQQQSLATITNVEAIK